MKALGEMVASYTGAWIETVQGSDRSLRRGVASYTGAWIETITSTQIHTGAIVASYTGAWIETLMEVLHKLNPASHPIRVRGLKHRATKDRMILSSRILYGCVD